MIEFYVIVNKSGSYEFVEAVPTFDVFVPSTMCVNDEACVNVYWHGRTEAEMINADDLVIPVHTTLMDIAIGRNQGGRVQ